MRKLILPERKYQISINQNQAKENEDSSISYIFRITKYIEIPTLSSLLEPPFKTTELFGSFITISFPALASGG